MIYKLLRSSVLCALVFAGVFPSASNAQVAHYGSETVIVNDSNVNAEFEAVAVDSNGNVYVGDIGTNTVFKYTLSGGVYTQTIVANTGLELPVGVAVDSNFNVYISDELHSRVLKETPNGGGYTQSVIPTSGITFPAGIAVDSSANVYVCDYANKRVLKETLQMGGTYVQSAIATGSSSSPIAVAVDSNGNLYINDSGTGTVLIETLSAGSYTQSTLPINSAYLNSFEGVAVDGSGNVYIANSGSSGTDSYTVLRETLAGGAYYPGIIGSGFQQPWGLGTDSHGNLYITNDFGQIIEISYPTTNFGTVNVGTTTSAFTLPFTIGANSTSLLAGGVVSMGASGTDYADAGTGTCDTNGTSHSYSAGNTCTVNVTFDPKSPGTRNGAVELVNTSNDVVATGYITGTGSAPQVAFPPGVQSTIGTSLGVTPGVAVDGKGNVFITDSTNKDVVKETFSAGSYTPSILASGYSTPAGLAVDGAGNIYISDAGSNFVGEETIYSPTIYQGSFVVPSGLSGPQGVAVDSNGNVYVADAGHNRVLEEVLNSLPNYDTIAYFQIVVASTGLSNPEGVAVDSSGNVFIADTGNSRILKETVTSSGNFTQSVVINTGLSSPEGLAIDNVGNLYIADSGDKRVLKETLSGATYTQSVVPLTGLGNPQSVALDASGNLYVADSTNHVVVKYTPSNLPSVSFATPTADGSADTTDDPKIVTVENVGNAVLNFSSIAASTNFTVDAGATTCSTLSPLPAGQSCVVGVDFVPTGTGPLPGTLTLTDNNLNVAGATQVIPLSGTGTAVVPPPQAATPVISPASGTFNAPVAVQITDSSPSPTIYYTTNSTAPSVSSPTYSGVFTVATSGTEVQAIATATGDVASNPATPATYTVNPVIAFNAAAVGIAPGSAQQLTAQFSLVGTTAPTAVLHYGHDYTLGTLSCTPNVGIEVCTVPVTFIPTLPGGRKDALFLMNGSTRIATVLLGGIGQAPLSLMQPGLVTNPIVGGPNYLYESTVDENGTVYVLDSESNAVISVTKAGVVSTLPIPIDAGVNNPTGLDSPNGVAIDGAGVLYIAQNTYSHSLLTYDTVQNIVGTLCVAPPSLGLSCTPGVNNEYLYDVANDAFGNLFALNIISPQNVFELTPSGNYVLYPSVGNPGPTLVAVDTNDNVFLAGGDMPGTGNPAIEEIVSGAQTSINTTGAGSGLAIDPAETIYATRYSVATVPPYDIAMLAASNYETPLAGIDGGTSGEIVSPLGLSLGSDGTLYVGNYTNLDKVDRTQGAIAFGEQNTNVASSAQVVGVYNGGNQNLMLSSFGISGTGFSMVPAVTNGCSASLVIAPGQLCNVDVTATLPHAGTFSGSITFTTNSLNTTSTTQTVNLTAFSYGPYVTTSPAATFGNWNVGTQPTIQVALSNIGNLYNANINLGVATLPAGFTISGGSSLISNTCAFQSYSIAPGASCLVTVTFSPTAAISYGGTISIPVASSGGGGPWPAATIAASGTGLSTAPSASLSPSPVTFTGQVAGTTSQIMAVQLSNSDVAQLTGITPSITGTNPSDFAIVTGSGSCGSTLAAGASCTIYVKFTPASAASFTATLSVTDNGSNSPQTATLNGAGVTFASNVGTAEAAQLVTVNISTAGTLNSILALTQGIANLDFTATTGGSCNGGTAYTVGQTCTVDVIFTPKYSGSRNGAIVLTDASNNVLGTVYLPGLGIGPEIVYGPGTLTSVPGTQVTPWGVAVDGAGNVYLNNTNFGSVLQIPWTGSAYGTAVTIATNIASALGKSITVDGAGNVFVGSNEPGAIVTEIPRKGTGWGPQVNIPTTGVGGALGITLDGGGSLYIADSSGKVVKLPWTGTGYGTQITLPATGLMSPYGVAVDAAGNVYIADHIANIVVELPWTGSGYGTQTTVPSAGLTSLTGLAVDGSSNLYVAGGTGSTSEIVRVPWSGSAYGTPTVLQGFDYTQVAVDGAGNVYGNEGLFASSELGIFKLDLADAPSLTFAATNAGSTSTDSPQTVPITNIGNASLTFSLDTDPAYPTDFPKNSSDTNLCTSSKPLTEGASCDVSASFKPTTGGPLSENVVLTDNNLNASGATQSIMVSGNGVVTTAPIAGLAPSPVAFTGQVVGITSEAMVVTLSNTGTAMLTGITPSITGTNPSDFAITTGTNACSTTLAASSSCFIYVTFTPASATSFTATLSVADNASPSPQTVTLTGTGTGPVATLSPAISFPNTTENTSATALSSTLINLGPGTLTGITPSIVGDSTGAFAIATGSNACGSSLAVNANCNIWVNFTPGTTGPFTATLSVADNAIASGSGSSSTSALNITYFTIAETDTDGAKLCCFVSNNYVQSALGPDGLPVYNPSATAIAGTGTLVAPHDLLAANKEITWWSPTLNNGGTSGASDVVATGSGVVSLPFVNDNFYAPNGTGSNDASAFQAAILSGNIYAPTAETISFTISSDDMAFLYLDGVNVCDDGGVHGATAVPCTTAAVSAGAHFIQLFYVDLDPTGAVLEFNITSSGVTSAPVSGSPQTVKLSGTGTAPLLTAQTISFTQPTTPQTYSAGLTISLVATGGASGNPVVFTVDSSSTGAGTISGSTLTVTTVGSFVIDANQAGNASYTAAPQVQRTVVVTQAPQVINFTQPTSPVTYSSGLTVPLSATGGASGNAVVFTVDASSTGTGTISGSTLTVTKVGNLVIDANQAGNADYSAAAQVQRTVVVNAPAPDFSVSATPPTQSVAPGGSAVYPITVADVGSAFTGTVTLSVSGLPTGATGTFSPPTVVPGSEGASSTLTVTIPATASVVRPSFWPAATPVLAVLLLLPFRRWRKVWKGKLVLLIAGMAGLACAASLTGCGGGFGLIQSQTYTLTVTGTSGTDTHSTTVQLTVTQ